MAFQTLSLGRLDYQTALTRQLELKDSLKKGYGTNTLLIVEHPKVITQGRRSSEEDFRVPTDFLKQQGYQVITAHRGGKLTYHGPGQLVAYFIFRLQDFAMSIPQFVQSIEQALIETCEAFGVHGTRRKHYPGVWVQDRKIAFIGLSIDRGISMHGIALNIKPNLEGFDMIVPCGMPECKITSLHGETKLKPNFGDVEQVLIQKVQGVFAIEAIKS